MELLPSGLVRVPYRDASGGAWNHKLFTADGRSWWEQSGLGLLAPFGLETVADPDIRSQRQLWITEGESDALTLREHYAAWRCLPIDIIGLPGAGSWRSEWAHHVQGYGAVYAFPDGDRAGDRMARAIGDHVPWLIRVAIPPGCDVRSVLQDKGPDEFDHLIYAGEASAVLLAGLRRCATLPELETFLAEVTW